MGVYPARDSGFVIAFFALGIAAWLVWAAVTGDADRGPWVCAGSHLDTQPDGGAYDGSQFVFVDPPIPGSPDALAALDTSTTPEPATVWLVATFLPIVLIGSFAAGGLWSGLVGFARARFGLRHIHQFEIVQTAGVFEAQCVHGRDLSRNFTMPHIGQ